MTDILRSTQESSSELDASTQPRRPRGDDRLLWDVVFALFGYPAPLIIHKFGIFELLGARPRGLLEICIETKLARRPAQALLSTAVSLGFLDRNGETYSLTPVAEDYLLKDSPFYFGHYWDLLIELDHIFSLSGLEQAIRTDAPNVYGPGDFYERHRDQRELAALFTRGMHSISTSAYVWPGLVDLSENYVLLDVAGGAGSHAIGAVRRWPRLRAVVFDLEAVCQEADGYVTKAGFRDRIETRVGDMWKDPYPTADVHFYSYIFHNWNAEKCQFLAAKSFDSLPPGGRIIIHQVLYNEDKSGPFAAAAFSMEMLAWTEGEQSTPGELSALLRDAGFREVEAKHTFGYCSMVTGVKPRS